MYFYVLIHALCVSVHFRAIYKCYCYHWKVIKEVSEEFLFKFKGRFSRDNISWRSALSSLWWVKIFLIRRQSVLFAKHLLCRHTPFKIKTLVSCIRFLLVFLCGCSLVRVTTRWWTLMVATHLLPLCLGESVFPWGFSMLSSPVLSLCSRSSRFATLGRGGSGEFRGGLLSLPVILWVTFSLSAVASPSPVFGGGGERTYYYHLLLCTAVTLTIDLIYEFPVTVGRKFTCVLDGFSDLNYVGLGG